MNPQTLQKLLNDVPELAEFRAFLAQKALKYNSLEGLAEMTPEARAFEATVRVRVSEVLKDILGPLLEPQESHMKADPKDFQVNVEDLPQ